MNEIKVTCLSINCPERTGGKCWFDKPISVKDKIMIAGELNRWMLDPNYKMSKKFENLFDTNKDKIFGDDPMT